TQIIGPKSPGFQNNGGIHHVYANARAFDGFASGKFADGASIVFELLEARENEGVTSEGARARLDGMGEDSAPYSATRGGRWARAKTLGCTRAAPMLHLPQVAEFSGLGVQRIPNRSRRGAGLGSEIGGGVFG